MTDHSRNDPLYRDMVSARNHRCYEMTVDEIADDLADRLPSTSPETVGQVAKMLKNWFDNAHTYWSENASDE